ncbi:MAG TPA: type IV pilus secretin PilQ [Hyphomicrobiales bacterium]|nr:type IV pilus secretin PilQ [Hyphomicrobiales bacterium]
MKGIQRGWQDLRDFDWSSLNEPQEAGGWPLPVRVLVVAAILLGGAGLGYWLCLAPLYREQAQWQRQKQTLQDDLRISTDAVAALAQVQPRLAQRQAQWEAVLATLPQAVDVPLRLEEIAGLGLGRNLTLAQLQMQAVLPGAAYVELPLAVVVQGGYHALAGFMSDLAAFAPPLALRDFTLEPGTEPRELRLSFDAALYRQPLPAEEQGWGNASPDTETLDVPAMLPPLQSLAPFRYAAAGLRNPFVPPPDAVSPLLAAQAAAQEPLPQEVESEPQAEAAESALPPENAEPDAPLFTRYLGVKYAAAQDLLKLLQREDDDGPGLLGERGSAAVDTRTNTLIVQGEAAAIAAAEALLARLDVPVRQVLIEARIVNASTSFSRALGVRWDLMRRQSGQVPPVPMPGAELLMLDLGPQAATSSLALGYVGSSRLLQLELAALEASGNGEVIAQPKVATQDQQMARIESGLQIPYQAQAGGTAGGSTTEFITAALSLQVTPQITPDRRIIMHLDIHQDAVVPGSGAVPAIATNAVTTRVLVNDGDTVVLGGVFRDELTTTVSKAPLLGDLPVVGGLFRRTENNQSKTELLIFITPSIINDLM